MSTWTDRKIARQLSERDPIEPPEGLLEKIKSEIPSDLGSRLPAAALREARTAEVVPIHRRQRWLIAASLILTVTGGLFAAMVVMRQTRSAEEAVMEDVEESPAQSAEASPAEPVAPAPSSAEPLAGPPPAAGEELAAKPRAESATRISAGEAKGLRDLGYVAEAPKNEADARLESSDLQVAQQLDRRRDVARQKVGAFEPVAEPTPPPPPPPPPPAPVEIPGAIADLEGVVEGGVEGGVVGGVAGGVPGGVVGASSSRGVYDEALRVGSKESDGPPQSMLFQSTGAHPFVETAKDRLSTFGLDVDTASYTVARRYLRDGHLPPRAAVRVEEFLNYFSYGDPPPARGDFALRAEGAASIFTQEPRTYLLRFNLRAREVKAEHRKPAVLTFVVDVSGSMDQGNRLGLVKQSLGLLLDQLRKDDKVGLVVYGTDARVLLEPTSDREMIRVAVNRLAPEGATNVEAGILLGYDVAGRSFRPGAINRILLCSDGVANQGATGPAAILGRIQREAKRGIELTTLGFGMGNYNDALMERLADQGNGRYAYLDDLDESRKVLVEELTGTLQTIAEDAKAQVEFFPGAVARWRLIGYENRDIPDERFRDNTVDAGEIGAGHSVTALYEVQLTPTADRSGKIASLHLRYRVPVTGELRETVRDLRVSELVGDWRDASPGFRLASLVVEFAETLRGSSHAGDLRKILRRAQRVVGEMAKQPRAADVAEFARLVEEAARIRGGVEKK